MLLWKSQPATKKCTNNKCGLHDLVQREFRPASVGRGSIIPYRFAPETSTRPGLFGVDVYADASPLDVYGLIASRLSP